LFQRTGTGLAAHRFDKLFVLAKLAHNLRAMIEEVRQRGVDLAERQMRQLLDDLVGREALNFGERVDVLHARACAGDVGADLAGTIAADFDMCGDFGLHSIILAFHGDRVTDGFYRGINCLIGHWQSLGVTGLFRYTAGMGILVGTDEAGYGPNFGPLVVAATAWEVAEGAGSREQGASGTSALHEVDLYRLLRPTVARSPHEKRIAIADSKLLYRPGFGLRQLERGLHAIFQVMRQPAACWSEILEHCGADADGHHQRLCWHDGFDCSLPVDATAEELARLGARLARACDTAGVRPLVIRARMVFPAEFNELVEHYGTKGAALSHVTVGLLREVVEIVQSESSVSESKKGTGANRQNATEAPAAETIGAGPLFAVCDKHGGRNFYLSLLQHHFSEHWIEPVFESHSESRYEWGPADARMGVSFRVGGERFLQTALASMTAKYLRELSMRAFNEFWRLHLPDLRPTAGYPMDSRRFKKAIATKQRELGIEDHILWRSR
jgi:hypothetical protein